jgi:O-antigen ligase
LLRAGALGAVFAAALVLWILVASVTPPQASMEMAVIALITIATFAAALVLSRRSATLVPIVVVLMAGVFAWLRGERLLGGPRWAPLGYSNAAGTLFMLAAAAAALWFVRARTTTSRVVAAVAAVAFAAVPVLNGTRTATALLCLLPAAVWAGFARQSRAAVVGSAAIWTLVLVSTVVLAVRYDPQRPRTGFLDRTVDATLSERRVQLWRDAITLTAGSPIVGFGPGQFQESSRTARAERDTRLAHNEFLQVAAEAGLPALLLLLAVIGCGYVMLWNAPDQRAAAVGAFTLGAAAVHGSVDYVDHFPAIPMAAAAIVAASLGSSRRTMTRGRNKPFSDQEHERYTHHHA